MEEYPTNQTIFERFPPQSKFVSVRDKMIKQFVIEVFIKLTSSRVASQNLDLIFEGVPGPRAR